MPRVNVWLPEELHEAYRSKLGDLNLSKALQEAIRDRLKCLHHTMACVRCAEPIDHLELIGQWLHKFYFDYLGRLELLVAAGGTAEGAARVLKDQAASWHAAGVMSRDYERHPMPRPSRGAQAGAGEGPPLGVKDWAMHPSARARAARQRSNARKKQRAIQARRREESA